VEIKSVLNINDVAGASKVGGRKGGDSHENSLPIVRCSWAYSSSSDLCHHSPLCLVLPGCLEGDHLHQVEEGAGHLLVGLVVHLGIEPDELPRHIPGPVGGDDSGDRTRLAAETAECLVVSAVTCLLGRGVEVEVQDTVHSDVLLHLVVPHPVPHDVRLDKVSHLTNLALKRRGKVGWKKEAEWEDMSPCLEAWSMIHHCLLLQVRLRGPEVIVNLLAVVLPPAIPPVFSPRLCPVNLPTTHQLHLDLGQLLVLAQVHQNTTIECLTRKENFQGVFKNNLKIHQPHGC